MDPDTASRIVAEGFRRWYGFLVRYADYCCNSGSLAEDFAQEAFLAYYERLRDGEEIHEPLAWMLRVVRNQSSKYWRAHRRHSEQGLTPAEWERLSGEVRVVPESRDGKGIGDYLHELSQREKQVLLLRYHGMKYRQIAAQLGITTNSVGTLLFRAVRKVRARARCSCSDELVRTGGHGPRGTSRWHYRLGSSTRVGGPGVGPSASEPEP